MSRFLRKIGLILAGAFLLAASPKAPAYTITMLWVRASAITFESEFTNPIERTVRFDTNTCQLQIYLSNEWRALNFGTQEVYLGIVSNSAYRGDWGWAASSEAARVEAWFTVTSNQLREADGALSNDIVLLESDLNTVSNYAYPRDWGIAVSNLADSALQPDDILTTGRYLSVTTVSNQDYVNFDSGPIFDVSNIIVHGWWSVQYFDFDATIVTNPDGVYFSNTLVRYQGDLYQAVSNIWSTNFYPWVGDAGTGQYVYPFPGQPGTGTQYWDLVVAKGEDGQSIQGPPGPPGQDGLGGFHFGPWHSTVYYEYNSETTTVVEYEQQWYRLIQSCSNVAPTSAEGTNYWTISIAKGADGELWGTNLIFRGEWDSGAQYYTNDAVSYAGNIYAITTNQEPQIGQNPPLYDSDGVGYDSAYWSVIVKRGVRGYKGDQGDPGTVITSLTYYTFVDCTNVLNTPNPTRPILVSVTTNSFRWSERTPVSTNWLTVTNGELLLNGESVQGVASFGTDSNTAYRGDWGNAVSNALDNRLVLGDIGSGDSSIQVIWSNGFCDLHVEASTNGGSSTGSTNAWEHGQETATSITLAPSTGGYRTVIISSHPLDGSGLTDSVIIVGQPFYTSVASRVVLIGANAGISGTGDFRSVVIGDNALIISQGGTAVAHDSVVIGSGAYAGSGGRHVVIGRKAVAYSSYNSDCVVIGEDANANYPRGVAIGGLSTGRRAASRGTGGIAIGAGAEGGTESIGVGDYATALGLQSIALGRYSHTPNGAANSIAIGYSARSSGTNQIQLGAACYYSNDNLCVIGYFQKAWLVSGWSETGNYSFIGLTTTNGEISYFWDSNGDGALEHMVGTITNTP